MGFCQISENFRNYVQNTKNIKLFIWQICQTMNKVHLAKNDQHESFLALSDRISLECQTVKYLTI